MTVVFLYWKWEHHAQCSHMCAEIIMYPGSPGNPSWYHFNIIIMLKKRILLALPESPFLKLYRAWGCLHTLHMLTDSRLEKDLNEIARANFTFTTESLNAWRLPCLQKPRTLSINDCRIVAHLLVRSQWRWWKGRWVHGWWVSVQKKWVGSWWHRVWNWFHWTSETSSWSLTAHITL